MENAAAKVVKLPWSRIRALSLSEIGGLYLDLSQGIRNLQPPKGLQPAEVTAYEETVGRLVIPFEEKGQEMRSKAFEIASRFSIPTSRRSASAAPAAGTSAGSRYSTSSPGATDRYCTVIVTVVKRLPRL